MRLVCTIRFNSSKDELKGRRWQWPVVQYVFMPPEAAIIVPRTVKYGWKVFLRLNSQAETKAIIKFLARYKQHVIFSNK